jgi:hypothetical protein
MPSKKYTLSVIVDVAHFAGDEINLQADLSDLFEPENLDVSKVGKPDGSVVVHDVLEPDAHGRLFYAQLCYTVVVEAPSEKEAIETVEENCAYYADGWEVEQLTVRPLS